VKNVNELMAEATVFSIKYVLVEMRVHSGNGNSVVYIVKWE
jgi:hypothetical protein